MASTSSSSVQGLASGIQWQDLIDQLISVDTTNQITPLTDKITANTNKSSAWTAFGTAVSTLQTTLKTLVNGTAFDALSVSVPQSGSTGRTLLTASTTSAAAPGTYGVQVLDTAAAQQLSGDVVADSTAALGLSGQFAVAGKVVTLTNTDSLNSVRDKINALNTGSNPSHISASVLHTGTTSARLVLSSDVGGAAGLDLRDVRATSSDPSMLTSLGFINGKTANVGSDGAVRSGAFSSATQNISALTTGITTFPAASTILVNGRSVTIDAQNKTLADIAAAINAQSPNTATVESSQANGTTVYNLKISGTVAASADAGSQPVLDLLGLSRGVTDSVKQQVSTSNTLLDANGSTATTATTLLGLKLASGNGAQSGDTFTIAGTKADGTKVSLTETVDGSKTIGDLLTDLGAAFSASGRTVTASLVNGKIQLTDETGGDSALSFSIAANNESGVADPTNGASLSFGSTTTVAGRARELTAGRDARIVVNGVLVTRNTNQIGDAITGVTLNLQQSEVGTTIPISIGRDTNAVIQTLQSVVTAYNTVGTLVSTDTASDGPLAYDSSMRSAFGSIKNALLSTIGGLPSGSTYNHAALIGLTVDKTGVLGLDTTALTTALQQSPTAVKALFQTNGQVTGTSFSYLTSSSATASGAYDVTITRAATQASAASTATSFTYAGSATPDTMTVGDAFSGQSGTISLATGDTTDTVVGKLNAMFQTSGVRATAANVGGKLTITGSDYGSTATFAVSYASTDGNDVAGQIGITAGTVSNGLDVQGSYSDGTNTYTATGVGQTLTGDQGSPVEGLMMYYTGTANSASAHVDFTTGLAGILNKMANAISASNGTVASQTTALTNANSQLSTRQDSVQARLDAKRAALTLQYTTMETALSKIQSQSTYLTQQINSLSQLQSSN